MKLLCLTLLLACTSSEVYSKSVCGKDAGRGYYWRDYTGEIPPDAIPGGVINGTTTYFGQALFSNGGMLIPGEINPDTKTVAYEYYGAAFTATEDIKILCSKHLDDFTWIEINSHDSISSVLDDNMRFITAGREGSSRITIGKTTDGDNERIGKVILGHRTADLYFAEIGKKLTPSSFKVLIYNPIVCEDRGGDAAEFSKEYDVTVFRF